MIVSALSWAVTGVLIREEMGLQKPVYYVSRVLHGPEEKYPVIDKFVFSLITSARKLKHILRVILST